MVRVIFEDEYHNRPLRMFMRMRQLTIPNGMRVYIYSKNEEDCGWWEVQEQRIGIGRSLLTRVTQFFTMSRVYS